MSAWCGCSLGLDLAMEMGIVLEVGRVQIWERFGRWFFFFVMCC